MGDPYESSLAWGGVMMDLTALKEALERPGIGWRRHQIAESFRGRTDVPLKWIRKWLSAGWHTIGCKYLWLAAMNACIGRPNVPTYIIYQGLCKTDPDTFNAAIEACRGLKVKPPVIYWWYGSSKTTLRIAAMTACIGKYTIDKDFVKKGLKDPDIRVRRIAEKILD